MTKISVLRTIGCLIAIAFVMTLGCDNNARVISQQKQYIIDAVRNGPTTQAKGSKILKVRRFSVSSPFESYELVLRMEDLQYKTDFYNKFLTSPGSIITDETRDWLNESNAFASVLDTLSSADYDYLMEGDIQAVYGDYRYADDLRAVMEIRFVLIDVSNANDVIVFDRQYRNEHSIKEAKADQLVKGLSVCLQKILSELENDLRQMPETIDVVE